MLLLYPEFFSYTQILKKQTKIKHLHDYGLHCKNSKVYKKRAKFIIRPRIRRKNETIF